jgi:hypothetical protein
VGAALVVSVAAAANSCTVKSAPPEPETCDDGKGVWIEDDNGVNEFLTDDQKVTVRICVDDGGNVRDIEVD